MNIVCLVGRLTAEPEEKKTQSDISVCSFSIAVNSSTKNADGTYKTDFINCVAWRGTAEFISRYFVKGQMIGLQGSIQTRQYKDKDTGKNRTAFDVVVNNAYFVESKPKSQNAPFTAVSAATADFTEIASDDGDLPF